MPRSVAIPRKCALRGACSGDTQFGERKCSSPQLRSPPRSGLLEYSVLYGGYLLFAFCGFVVCAFGVRPRTTPFLVFKIALVVSLPLRNCTFQYNDSARPLALTLLAEIARGAALCACPMRVWFSRAPTRVHTNPARYAGGSLEN